MDELKRLSQIQYNSLMSRLAGALHTQRKLITVVGVKRASNGLANFYKVKRKGEYYPYLIEETLTRAGNIYSNLGVIIFEGRLSDAKKNA